MKANFELTAKSWTKRPTLEELNKRIIQQEAKKNERK